MGFSVTCLCTSWSLTESRCFIGIQLERLVQYNPKLITHNSRLKYYRHAHGLPSKEHRHLCIARSFSKSLGGLKQTNNSSRCPPRLPSLLFLPSQSFLTHWNGCKIRYGYIWQEESATHVYLLWTKICARHHVLCLVTQLCPSLCEPMDCSQTPLSVGILQARILAGLSCPPPGDLPNPGIEPRSSTL